jgi:hypothetical protein
LLHKAVQHKLSRKVGTVKPLSAFDHRVQTGRTKLNSLARAEFPYFCSLHGVKTFLEVSELSIRAMGRPNQSLARANPENGNSTAFFSGTAPNS